jgi:hypothetical protein
MRARRLIVACAATISLGATATAGTTSLLVTNRPARPSAHVTYSSSDGLAGLAKGSATSTSGIAVRMFVTHDGASTQFVIPSGAYGGFAGWLANDARALYSNRAAPSGPTGVSRTSFATGRRVQLMAKSLGDVTPLAFAAAPSDVLRVAYVVTNGAETSRHCTQFLPGSCTYTPLDAGTGWRLRCRDGIADPSCGAAPACGNGVRDPGEECDGPPPLCTPDCRLALTSCCQVPGQCTNAPAYTLYTLLIQSCQSALGVGVVPYDGLSCNALGTCVDLPIEPTSVCCQTTATTCSDSIRSSLHELYIARHDCAAMTGLDVTKTHFNSVCDPSGSCIAQ